MAFRGYREAMGFSLRLVYHDKTDAQRRKIRQSQMVALAKGRSPVYRKTFCLVLIPNILR